MSRKKESSKAKYERWWLNRMCKLRDSVKAYRKVVRVQWVGSGRGVYGDVWLHYEDGSSEVVQCGTAFKPRKHDVEVLDA